MAKTPIKKVVVKKTVKKTVKKIKKAAPKKLAAKKLPAKKRITDKEREERAANFIANSEKKKTNKRPKKIATKEQTSSLLDSIVEGMKERKAKNITILNLTKLENRVTDFFVICDADSNTHVNSISHSLEDTVLKLSGEKAYHSEGHQNGEWILVDYINIVAHIFLRDIREYYNIEGLWGDAEITSIKS